MQFDNDGLTDALYNELGILPTTRIRRTLAIPTRRLATTRVAPRRLAATRVVAPRLRATPAFASRVQQARVARFGRAPVSAPRRSRARPTTRPAPRRKMPQIRTQGCPEPHLDRLFEGSGVLASLTRIEARLVKAALQRLATSEHRNLLQERTYRKRVLAALAKIVTDRRLNGGNVL